MTKLLLALNLTPTKLLNENLLHGAKLRGLITNIENEMEDHKGSPPPIWIEYKKELEKIRNETFTTLRDKSLTKLGMKISGIANEVAKTVKTNSSNSQTGTISTNQEAPIEIARKNLLRKINAVNAIYNNCILKEVDPTAKLQLELSLILIDSLKEDVTTETVLTEFTNHESKLEEIKREGTKPFESSFDPQKKQTDFKDKDLAKFKEKFENELADLEKHQIENKYSWRAGPFNVEKQSIEKQLSVLGDTNKEMNERLVALNLAELLLARLAAKFKTLNIPVDMSEALQAKDAINEFVKDLDKLIDWLKVEFTANSDMDEINKVIPAAVTKAKAPLQRLVNAIVQVESLLTGCSTEKEAILSSYGLQVFSLAGLCVKHCDSDQLLAAWDSCPQKTKNSAKELKTAIETIAKQFRFNPAPSK
jgi:hypothetical protein